VRGAESRLMRRMSARHITTHFLRSLTSGPVSVEAVPLNQGRTQQLWQVDIKDGEGRFIAHGEVRLQHVEGAASQRGCSMTLHTPQLTRDVLVAPLRQLGGSSS
jgi:hypothetical protein